MSPAWFRRHVVFVPVVWLVAAIVSWNHPGDECGLFVATSLSGMWIIFLIDVLHLRDVIGFVLGAGTVVTAALLAILLTLAARGARWFR